MQGLYVDGVRPKSKKQVKETPPEEVRIEATSLFGNEYDGPLSNLPIGTTITYVGPDPYTSRRFYGSIKKVSDMEYKYS